MEYLKELFGNDGKQTLDYEGFCKAVKEKGLKLADLSTGEYVGKGKYESLDKEYGTYRNDTESKLKEYDSLKTKLDTYVQREEIQKLYDQVKASGVDEKFVRFVTNEVKDMVSENKDFKTSLEEFNQSNPQFIANNKKVFTVNSSVNLDGGNQSQDIFARLTEQIKNKVINK